jgi:response regulator RpfG family c-di-GMP phosphodiesterase
MPIILCTGCSDKPDGNSPVDSGIQEIVMRPIRQVDPIRTVLSGLDEAASSM